MVVPDISNIVEKNVSDVSMNFEKLRDEALAYVQKYSGAEWTDFNLHDPGITILEAICFALTDLSFRTGFTITDILSDAKGNVDYEDQSFHLAPKILNTHPVSINDYRKIVIDQVTEVQNIWISSPKDLFGSRSVRGFYNVSLQLTVSTWQTLLDIENEQENTIKKEAIIQKVKNVLFENRMIGNDFYNFKIVEPKNIKIIAKISVDNTESPEEVLAQIFWAINNFLNPSVDYFLPNELLDKNINIQDIFNGPTLVKGVINDETLRELPKQIDPADIVRLAGKVKGVVNVISLSISDGNKTTSEEPLFLKEGEFGSIKPLLDFTSIELYKEGVDVIVRKQTFASIYKKFVNESENKFLGYSSVFSDMFTGQFRNISNYHSIQHHFPIIYGIGNEGISRNESNDRKAAVKQLKAYLLVFEQIMGNYLSQLSSVNKLFSHKIDAKHSHTYFSQPILDVPGINDLISFISMLPVDKNGLFKKKQYETAIVQYQQTLTRLVESDSDYVDRKNAFLDHMLSRFNYSLNSYPVELAEHYYQLKNLQKNDDVLLWKSEFLKNIVSYSANRARGTHYQSNDNKTFDFMHLLYKILFINNAPYQSTLKFLSNSEDTKISIDNTLPSDDNDFEVERKLVLLDEVITIRNQSHTRNNPTYLDFENELLIFEHQNELIFRDACNHDNFKITPNVFTNEGYLILYNQIVEKEWVVVGKSKSLSEAKIKIQKTVQYFINISLQSEGIHIVENILLLPNVLSNSFGFQFLLKNGATVILKNNNWLSFADRNNLLSYVHELIQINDLSVKEKLVILNKYFDITDLRGLSLEEVSPEIITTIYAQIESVFKDFSKNDYKLINEQIVLLVRLSNGYEIEEAFFDSQLSFYIPQWPARFQDENFKKFINKIISEFTPIHLKLNINYLTIDEMKNFENIYFYWLSMLQVSNGKDFQKTSFDLISLMNKS
jgi:hypothetical protein